MNELLIFPERFKFRIFREKTDMRKGFNKLGELVYRHLGKPGKGEKIVFFFFNSKGDGVKVLFYDERGKHIFYTILDQEKFVMPYFEKDQKTVDLDTVTLMAMLQGLKLYKDKSA